ncbi:MAG: hypothetical protein EPO39_13310, partial [Candidatus Manganitrophaceae bacterium]
MKSWKETTQLRSLFVIYLLTLTGIGGCTGQSNPPASLSQSASAPPGVEARIFVGNTNGKVSVIEHGDTDTLAD